MSRVRFASGLGLVGLGGVFMLAAIWHLLSPEICGQTLCQNVTPYTTPSQWVEIYASVVIIARGISLMRERRTGRRSGPRLYAAAALIPCGIADMAIIIMQVKQHKPLEQNPTLDFATDLLLVTVGFYLLTTYRSSKRTKAGVK